MPRKRKKETTSESGEGLSPDPELIQRLVAATLDRANERATGRAKEDDFRARARRRADAHLGYETGYAKTARTSTARATSASRQTTTFSTSRFRATAKGTSIRCSLPRASPALAASTARSSPRSAGDPRFPSGDARHRSNCGLRQHGNRQGDRRGARRSTETARADVSRGRSSRCGTRSATKA